MKYFYFFAFFILSCISLQAQPKKELSDADKSALEGIIVEKYYISDSTDYKDTLGGILPKGAITYRIYVDMKPGYKLQAVYGVPNHELRIETTTEFFNNKDGGNKTGDLINDKKINENTIALDSWLAMGGATKLHMGILKADDKDGSIMKRKSLDKTDGLIMYNVPSVAYFGIDPNNFFHLDKKPVSFSSDNGSIAVFGGVKGPTDDNRVLIAQLTTNGKISFLLNLQIGTPSGGTVQFVAKNPEDAEIKFDALTY